MHRIALLSNVNMSFVLRLLRREFEIYETEGYGNELGLMVDPSSSYHLFAPEMTFLIIDLMELLGHDTALYAKGENPHMEEWFAMLEGTLKPETVYYVSDAWLWGPESGVTDAVERQRLESEWLDMLLALMRRHHNVRLFPYRSLIGALGEENSFSLKTWYMGKILHTNELQKRLGAAIGEKVRLECRIPKKVLLLDLDNTLWGGLAGENDTTPIQLSDDHEGLCYKNLQRVIRQMQQTGVLLAIVSKNNEEDALEIIRNHPHMVLREEAFAARRINWQQKHVNIGELAGELNLGTDSFVFWDDSPTERELIREMMPEVTVPDFPEKPEDLAGAMRRIYREYFEKSVITKEDADKTRQYAENARRTRFQEELAGRAVSFEEYLERLQIRVTRVEPEKHMERFHQLVNKTNQFNLTTKRYDPAKLQKTVEDFTKKVYLYRVEDKFGDYGIVAAAVVDCGASTDAETVPFLEEFVMSCRVMGKNIENTIIREIEEELTQQGYTRFRTAYLPTAKNKPVEQLFERLGYEVTARGGDGAKEYEKRLM